MGERLTARILEELRQLDMPRVQFQCQFARTELGPMGADAVAFYMSANVGEALKPMNKVASGGELARIMLALKNVLAQQDQVATLIFDEVDTGVSGRAAQKVAGKAPLGCQEQAGSLRHPPAPDCRLGRYPSAHRQGGAGRTGPTPL